MRKSGFILLLGALLAVSGAPALGAVLNSGIDTARQPLPASGNHGSAGCSVLWFGTDNGEPGRFTGLGFNVTVSTNPGDLTASNLSNYSILVIAYVGPGFIGGAQQVIQNYVQAGHGLLIHQPNAIGAIDYAPFNFGVNTLNQFWCNFPGPAQATIVDASHPITAGLTDADLSGAFDDSALDPGYHVLATSVACGGPALAEGTFGSGRIVYDTGNGSPFSAVWGTDQYWMNIFSWLCVAVTTPTRGTTWGELKALYR
jgi:hypothetical protein